MFSRQSIFRVLARVVAVFSIALLTACASVYVDTNSPEVSVSQFKKPATPRAAQVLFEFQTKGVLNVRGTEVLKAKVLEQVKMSGLFSSVTEGPAPDGQMMSITLNNVPLSDDAMKKGFITGATFGIAGSHVSDGYICTIRYTAQSGATAITKEARHAIHTTLGATNAPPQGKKAASIEEAVTLMTREVVSKALNAVSHDPSFK